MSMPEIERVLKQLRLSGVRATLETRILESQASNLNFLETFSLILQDELDRRQSRLIDRLYRTSGLDERTSLEEFDWGYNPKIPKRLCFELHTLKFIHEGSNVPVHTLASLIHDGHHPQHEKTFFLPCARQET